MKTGWKRCLTLLLALLVLQGCVPAYAAGERPASDYREDYAFLWDTLRENDPFLPHLQELGINADRLEEEYGELLETVTDDASFYLLLRALFAAMRNDCHLALLSPAAFFALRGYIEENPELYREKTRALLRDEKVLQAYESLTLPDRAAEPVTLPPSVTYYSAEKSLVFHFPSFEAEGAVRDSALVREALLSYPEAAHIVFDITGNLGGSDAYWMDVIVNPFGGDYRYESEIYFMDSPLTRDCGYVEGATPLSDRALDAERAELLRSCGFTHCVSLTVANDPQKAEPLPEAGKTARRWVLIDAPTFSAADSFAAFCKETGWATLVGRQTRGDGGNVGPMIVGLPRTGFLFRFSYATTLNSDGSLNSLQGTLPDFVPKPGEAILEACLRLIRAVG